MNKKKTIKKQLIISGKETNKKYFLEPFKNEKQYHHWLMATVLAIGSFLILMWIPIIMAIAHVDESIVKYTLLGMACPPALWLIYSLYIMIADLLRDIRDEFKDNKEENE